MSVIGRLDDQVEAILINPLKRERTAGDDETGRAAPTVAPPAPSREEREAETQGEARDEVNAALPVWLL